MKNLKLVAITGIAFLLVSAASQASLIRITPIGVAVDEQVITDPVPISSDGFRLSYWGGGSSTILDPLVVIFATPDGATPTLTATGASNPVTLSTVIDLGGTTATAAYGGNWNTTTGAGGTFDSTDSGSVYADLNLANAGGSQNYTNWNGASGETSWSLYVYTIVFDPDLAQGNWIEFSTTNLATNSFVVGYGCTGLNSSESACGNSGTTEDTPFTFAGHVTKVPEPGTLALFSLGLIGLGLARRRREEDV